MICPKPIRQERTRKRLAPIGRRGREWDSARRRVKAEFALAGITRCEFGYDGCYGRNALTFAHAVKRRYLLADAEPGSPWHIETVALACLRCHTRLDVIMNHGEMLTAVMLAIERRNNA
jgi:hypothetical protein